MNALAGGVAYATAAFIAGFILGSLRVLWVAPRIGAVAAVLLETPIILAISWRISLQCTRRLSLARSPRGLVSMGVIAFVFLQLLEAGLAVFLFGRSVAEFIAAYGTTPGLTGLAAQICFALIPIVQSLNFRR